MLQPAAINAAAVNLASSPHCTQGSESSLRCNRDNGGGDGGVCATIVGCVRARLARENARVCVCVLVRLLYVCVCVRAFLQV